jgi:TatD DNase family protein
MPKNKKEIPALPHPIIETHCHLDYLKSSPLGDIVEKSLQHNIERILTISVAESNFNDVLNITKTFDNVWGSQGVHPHHAKDYNQDTLKKVRTNAQDKKILAIGEIGLDFYYNNSEKSDQLKVFTEHLELATELGMPVVIHSREAEDETIEIMKNFVSNPQFKGVIHSFTSSKKLADFALKHGFYLGFNGIISFNSAKDLQEIVKTTPIDNIILETDAPFLTPVPFRGRENAPYYLPCVATKLAEIHNVDLDYVCKKTYENSIKLFWD